MNMGASDVLTGKFTVKSVFRGEKNAIIFSIFARQQMHCSYESYGFIY